MTHGHGRAAYQGDGGKRLPDDLKLRSTDRVGVGMSEVKLGDWLGEMTPHRAGIACDAVQITTPIIRITTMTKTMWAMGSEHLKSRSEMRGRSSEGLHSSASHYCFSLAESSHGRPRSRSARIYHAVRLHGDALLRPMQLETLDQAVGPSSCPGSSGLRATTTVVSASSFIPAELCLVFLGGQIRESSIRDTIFGRND